MNTLQREEFVNFYEQSNLGSVENILKSMLKELNSIQKGLIATSCKRKSVEKFQEIINESKKLFITTPVLELLKIYSQAIAYAPNNSAELARAYGNRSAILYNARLYEDSLKDIDRAIALNCSNSLKIKLYFRKAKNLLALNPKNQLKTDEVIAKARCWLEEIDDDNNKKLYMSQLEKFKRLSSKSPFKKSDNSFIVPDIVDPHEQLIGSSKAIELTYSKQFGRHFIATRDIKPGEILVKQRAYAFILPRKLYYANCWNCSKRAWSNVPCKSCPNVVFCDESCRDEAWNNFHDIECLTINFLPTEELENVNIMGLKLTIKALKEAGTVAALKEKLKAIDSISDPLTKGFIDGKLDSSKYTSIYGLTHTLSKFMDVRLRILLTCAHVLLTWAKKTSIFGVTINNPEEIINNKLIIFIGKLLMRNEIICATSSFEGSYNHQDILYDDDEDSDRGGMLACLTSFFNHSCDANARQVHSGDIIGIRSNQNIKKGEQIFICYYKPYFESSTIDRQIFLEIKYNFRCDCHACNKDWGLHTKWPSFMNLSLSGQALFEVSKALIKYGLDFEKECDEKEIKKSLLTDPRYIPALSEVLNILYKYIDNPCVETFSYKEMLTFNFMFNSY